MICTASCELRELLQMHMLIINTFKLNTPFLFVLRQHHTVHVVFRMRYRMYSTGTSTRRGGLEQRRKRRERRR